MGQADAERKDRVAALVARGKEGKKEAAKLEGRWRRSQSMRAMGIFEPSQAVAVSAAFASGVDPQRAMAALRWDLFNPWARTLELLSSHPLVAHRIRSLEESGLPGAPTTWSVLRSSAVTGANPTEVATVRRAFPVQVATAVMPWVLVVVALVGGFLMGSATVVGLALVGAGAAFVLKQAVRYPRRFEPAGELTGLLARLDGNPVTGIPVTVRGTIIGRGTPGYVLSPDLVVQDPSGFVPLLYRQPIPFARAWFGLFQAETWMGRQVTVHGWYRRNPGPVIELASLEGDGSRARTWEWAARTGAAFALVAIGIVVLLAGMA